MGHLVRLGNDVGNDSEASDRLQTSSPYARQSKLKNDDQLRDLMVRYQRGDAACGGENW